MSAGQKNRSTTRSATGASGNPVDEAVTIDGGLLHGSAPC